MNVSKVTNEIANPRGVVYFIDTFLLTWFWGFIRKIGYLYSNRFESDYTV